jgi:hypothetical protein
VHSVHANWDESAHGEEKTDTPLLSNVVFGIILSRMVTLGINMTVKFTVDRSNRIVKPLKLMYEMFYFIYFLVKSVRVRMRGTIWKKYFKKDAKPQEGRGERSPRKVRGVCGDQWSRTGERRDSSACKQKRKNRQQSGPARCKGIRSMKG